MSIELDNKLVVDDITTKPFFWQNITGKPSHKS